MRNSGLGISHSAFFSSSNSPGVMVFDCSANGWPFIPIVNCLVQPNGVLNVSMPTSLASFSIALMICNAWAGLASLLLR